MRPNPAHNCDPLRAIKGICGCGYKERAEQLFWWQWRSGPTLELCVIAPNVAVQAALAKLVFLSPVPESTLPGVRLPKAWQPNAVANFKDSYWCWVLCTGNWRVLLKSGCWIPVCLLWHGKDTCLSHKLAEIFQSAGKLRIIHLMLNNLSLKCSSPPECDHGICNLNILEVQVK